MIDQHPEMFYLVYLPFWILVSIAYVFFAPLIVDGLSIQWGLVVIWAAALFHKNTKLTIPIAVAPERPVWRWLLECWVFQSALILVMMGFSHLFSTSPMTIFHHFIKGYAIGPMLLFSLIAGAVAVVYAKGKRPYISSTLTPIYNNTHLDRVGVMADAYTRSSNLVSLSMTVVTLILTILHMINQHFGIKITTGINVPMIILMTAMVFGPAHKKFGTIVRPLINRLPYVLAVLVVALVSIVMIYVIYFAALAITPPNSLKPKIFANWDWEQYSLIATFYFLLSWCAPYPGMMVHLAQGYKVRTMLVVSMIIPVLWALWLLYFPPGKFFHLLLPWLTIISCVYLLILFLQRSQVTYLLRASLPTSEPIKQRSAYGYIKGIMMYSLTMVGSYFLTGVYLVGYAPFIMMMPVAILMTLGIAAIFSGSRNDNKKGGLNAPQ